MTATAAPCTSLYKPVEVDHPVDIGPPPDDHFDPRTLWWRHERFHRQAMHDPPRLFPLFIAERDKVQRDWLAEPPDAAAAFTDADGLLERWTAAVSAEDRRDRRPWWVRRYWRERHERAAATLSDSAPFQTGFGGA